MTRSQIWPMLIFVQPMNYEWFVCLFILGFHLGSFGRVFNIFKWLKEKSEQCYMPYENYMKFEFVSINKGVLGHSHAHSFTYH